MPPAAQNIYGVASSVASLNKIPTTKPGKRAHADRNVHNSDCCMLIPALISTAKVPNLWVTSSNITATDIEMPARMLRSKAAPIDSPSMTFRTASPNTIIQATVSTDILAALS